VFRGRLFGKAALLLLLFALAMGGCSSNQSPEWSPPWQEGEVTVMEIEKEGELFLVQELQVKKEGEALLFITEHLSTNFPQRRQVTLDASTLLPLRTEFDQVTEEGKSTLLAVYEDRNVGITREDENGSRQQNVTLPGRAYYDFEQLPFLVRALPLEEGWRGKLNLLVAPTARKVVSEIAVTGREEVNVPAGTFDAYIVEAAGLEQKFWVAVEPPHQLVKHENGITGLVSELAQFFPQGR